MEDRDDPILRDILDRAVEVPADQLAAFLDDACGDNAEWRAEVASLLAALEQADNFLLDPALGPNVVDAVDAATVDAAGVHDVRVGSHIGPYKLLQPIGEGGMGVVYIAEQRHPVKRTVAVKLIKAGFDSKEVLTLFESERQALARMEHPHIAGVLDAGVAELCHPYFAMQYVPSA